MNMPTVFAITAVFIGLVFMPNADAKHDKDLPPGLQKKVARGEPLPPGWQKKLHKGDILDYDIYDRGRIVVPLDSHGRVSIQVEGALIKLDEKTRTILDVVNIITD